MGRDREIEGDREEEEEEKETWEQRDGRRFSLKFPFQVGSLYEKLALRAVPAFTYAVQGQAARF